MHQPLQGARRQTEGRPCWCCGHPGGPCPRQEAEMLRYDEHMAAVAATRGALPDPDMEGWPTPSDETAARQARWAGTSSKWPATNTKEHRG